MGLNHLQWGPWTSWIPAAIAWTSAGVTLRFVVRAHRANHPRKPRR